MLARDGLEPPLDVLPVVYLDDRAVEAGSRITRKKQDGVRGSIGTRFGIEKSYRLAIISTRAGSP